MFTVILAILTLLCLLGCQKHVPIAVLAPAQSIEATTENGTIRITYISPTKRKFEWDGNTRTAKLTVRHTPFHGRTGLYDPAPSWGFDPNEIRLVADEAVYDFDNQEQLNRFLYDHAPEFGYVYTNDGLVVRFRKTPPPEHRRRCDPPSTVSFDLYQLLIRGEKPTTMKDANPDQIARLGPTPEVAPWTGVTQLTNSQSKPISSSMWYDIAMDSHRREESNKYSLSRWRKLGWAAKESLIEGHDAQAKALAEEQERLAPGFIDTNKYGNIQDFIYLSMHDFNTVLGRLALKSGDLQSARNRLLEVGRIPVNRYMQTGWRPSMALARDLLEKGEKDVVLEYFELCRKFWTEENARGERLDRWKKQVEAGQIPDFGINLYY